jgi:peptide/nickel transport system substrate-binding protein
MTRTRAHSALLALAALGVLALAAATGATSAAPPSLKNGGTLTIGLAEDPDALDPTLARTFVGRIVFMHMCEKLYDIDSHLNIVPQLAASMPTFSTNKRTVTIKIRTGLKFNDGTTLDAAAVRCRSTGTRPCPLGARERALPRDVDRHAGQQHGDPAPRQPVRADHAQLADRSGMIMSPKALNDLGANFASNPVCVGPFMFKDRVAGDHITLVKSRTTTARRRSTSTRSRSGS